MSSVIIGKPNIKWLQTFADKKTVIDTTDWIGISEFKTNVQEVYDNVVHYVSIGSFLSAGATATYELYDKDLNLITSWSYDNSANTTTMKALKVYGLGYFKRDRYPLKLKITAVGTVETNFTVHPISWDIKKNFIAERLYFGTNNIDIGDSGGSLWKVGGISIVLFASEPDTTTNNNLWGIVYGSSIGIDRPIKFGLYYQNGQTETTTNSTSLIVRLVRGILFWV